MELAANSSTKPIVELDLISRLEERQYEDIEQDLRLALGLPLKTCTACGVSKTTLWRNGPEGPKTLCNLCGIRYRKAVHVDTNLTLGPSNSSIEAYRRRN